MKKICLLIPCYNEEATVAKVVSDFRRCLPEMEIYVYDNNSTDGTAREALGAGARVVAEPAQGKGNVVRSMFRDIDADAYVMVDGDDTYPAEALMRVLQPVLDGRADMVIGDRLSNGSYERENRRNFHSLGNNLVRSAVNRFFGTSLSDIMTGYRAFSRRFVKNFPALSGGFQLETEMTIFALSHHMRIVEVPIDFTERPRRELLEAQHVPRRSESAVVHFQHVPSLSAAGLFLVGGVVAGAVRDRGRRAGSDRIRPLPFRVQGAVGRFGQRAFRHLRDGFPVRGDSRHDLAQRAGSL